MIGTLLLLDGDGEDRLQVGDIVVMVGDVTSWEVTRKVGPRGYDVTPRCRLEPKPAQDGGQFAVFRPVAGSFRLSPITDEARALPRDDPAWLVAYWPDYAKVHAIGGLDRAARAFLISMASRAVIFGVDTAQRSLGVYGIDGRVVDRCSECGVKVPYTVAWGGGRSEWRWVR